METIYKIAKRVQSLRDLFNLRGIRTLSDEVITETGEVLVLACRLAGELREEYMMMNFSDFLIDIVQEVQLNRPHLNHCENKQEFSKAYEKLIKANNILFDRVYDDPDNYDYF